MIFDKRQKKEIYTLLELNIHHVSPQSTNESLLEVLQLDQLVEFLTYALVLHQYPHRYCDEHCNNSKIAVMHHDRQILAAGQTCSLDTKKIQKT